MEELLGHIPSWVCYIAVFFFGYGVCRLINTDDIDEGRKIRQAEEDRLTAFIAELKEEKVRYDAEYEAKQKARGEQCGTTSLTGSAD